MATVKSNLAVSRNSVNSIRGREITPTSFQFGYRILTRNSTEFTTISSCTSPDPILLPLKSVAKTGLFSSLASTVLPFNFYCLIRSWYMNSEGEESKSEDLDFFISISTLHTVVISLNGRAVHSIAHFY